MESKPNNQFKSVLKEDVPSARPPAPQSKSSIAGQLPVTFVPVHVSDYIDYFIVAAREVGILDNSVDDIAQSIGLLKIDAEINQAGFPIEKYSIWSCLVQGEDMVPLMEEKVQGGIFAGTLKRDVNGIVSFTSTVIEAPICDSIFDDEDLSMEEAFDECQTFYHVAPDDFGTEMETNLDNDYMRTPSWNDLIGIPEESQSEDDDFMCNNVVTRLSDAMITCSQWASANEFRQGERWESNIKKNNPIHFKSHPEVKALGSEQRKIKPQPAPRQRNLAQSPPISSTRPSKDLPKAMPRNESIENEVNVKSKESYSVKSLIKTFDKPDVITVRPAAAVKPPLSPKPVITVRPIKQPIKQPKEENVAKPPALLDLPCLVPFTVSPSADPRKPSYSPRPQPQHDRSKNTTYNPHRDKPRVLQGVRVLPKGPSPQYHRPISPEQMEQRQRNGNGQPKNGRRPMQSYHGHVNGKYTSFNATTTANDQEQPTDNTDGRKEPQQRQRNGNGRRRKGERRNGHGPVRQQTAHNAPGCQSRMRTQQVDMENTFALVKRIGPEAATEMIRCCSQMMTNGQ